MTPPQDIVLTPEEQARVDALTEGARKKEVERIALERAADEKNTGVDYYAIAQELLRTGDLVSFNNIVYRYRDGIFTEDKGELESQIQVILQYRGIGAKEKVTTATAQVLHYIRFDSPCREYPFNQSPNAIPLENGVLVLDFNTGAVSLQPHSPEFRFNYKLKAKYIPDAGTAAVLKYLDSLGVERDLLLQIPAHAILSMLGRVYKRAYFLRGDRDSGKSTFTRLITHHLFGPAICSSISIHDLLFDRFRLADLDGKILNAYADLADSRISNLGLFKALTGGDAITVERKHRDPYATVNKAVFLFSANRYPKIKGADAAWWDRWIAINFNGSFPKDPEFEKTHFTDEFVSGLLLLVIERMTAIIQAKRLETTDNVERDWLSDASSGYAFIRDRLERCRGAILVKRDVYAMYVEYCNDAEFEVESQRALFELMKQAGAIDTYPSIRSRREHCFQGFKIKDSLAIFPDTTLKDGDILNILHNHPENTSEKMASVQDVQESSNLLRVKEKEESGILRIEKVSASEPAHPAHVTSGSDVEISWAGKSLKELSEILMSYLPGRPPHYEQFQAAWKAAGGGSDAAREVARNDWM